MDSDTEGDSPTRRRPQHLWKGGEEQEEKEDEKEEKEEEEEREKEEASEEATGRFSFPLSQNQMERLATPKDHFLQAIHEHPDNGLAYLHLGTHLRRGGKIVLLNGKEMTKQEIYLKALDLLPSYPYAYLNVGCTVDDDQVFFLSYLPLLPCFSSSPPSSPSLFLITSLSFSLTGVHISSQW
jgi:hypothetical protein